MGLKQYQSKRKFTKTSEPKGKTIKSTDDLVFVIQKHNARALHFDFRLEHKGVLKSWAVPKKPPQKVGVKRLAVKTEDHPVEYADFEGKIPAGEYGAGTVEIWDKGIWIPESVKKDKIIFELKGKKLKGRFALVGFTGEKKNWLFFKLKQ